MAGQARDVEGLGDVIGDLRDGAHVGNAGGDGGGGFVECGRADVNGLVEDLGLEAGGGAEQDAGFSGGACAELGDCDGGGEQREDFVGVCGEERGFSAGEVVLRESGDLLEELGTELVIEEPRGERFLGAGEAGDGFVEHGRVDGGSFDGGHEWMSSGCCGGRSEQQVLRCAQDDESLAGSCGD
jgi:hypothetical protein